MSSANKSTDSPQEPLGTKRESPRGTQVHACATSRRGMMCLNPKVVVGLLAVAIGTWAVAPELAAAALPLLILAACPLSMVLMMRAMRGSDTQKGDVSSITEGDLAHLKGKSAELAAEQERLSREIRKREASETAGLKAGLGRGSTDDAKASLGK